MSALSFQVRVGIPGALTIEIATVDRSTPLRPAALFPPLQQAVLRDSGGLMAKAWGEGWAIPMNKRLVALGGNSNLQLLTFECPSLDRTDNAWGMTGSLDAASDSATITGVPFGASNFGRAFEEGDYILWDDPTLVTGLYQYEIDLITAVQQNTFTLARAAQGGDAGRAQFGSVKAAHGNVKFYQLVMGRFGVLWEGHHEVFKFLWDQMIVAAVSAATVGLSAPTIVNLAPIPPTAATPGLAT
ncbi:MAG: hypothetical protein V4502_08100 [Pseudomonadota bacterium]